MSRPDPTEGREATIGIDNRGCLVDMTDNLLNVESIKVEFHPESAWTYGDEGQYTGVVPECVSAYIGGLRLTLSPAVWRGLFDAVNEVLPQGESVDIVEQAVMG